MVSARMVTGAGCAAALWMSACESASKQSEPAWQTGETPTEQKSALTPGGAKLYLKKGTTQAEVSQNFGAPDRVTHQDDMQVWIYDKTSYEYHKESGYFTVLFAGAGGDRVRSSSRSTLLTIYFDPSDHVVDYRLSTIKY